MSLKCKTSQPTKRIKGNCQFCGLLLSDKNNTLRHERHCTLNEGRSKGEQCPNCKNCYSVDYLKRHLKRCFAGNLFSPSRCKTPCFVKNCNRLFFHKKKLVDHIRVEHVDYEIKDVVEKKFQTYADFLEWKKTEEESSYSFFSKKSGFKPNDRTEKQYFYCQRDGSANLHYERKSNRQYSKGRVKVGDFCIAKMKVWKDEDETICLQYFPTHSHPCNPKDLLYHPLRKYTPPLTNQELSGEVSPNNILKKITRVPDLKTRITVKNGKLNVIYRRKLKASGVQRKTILGLDNLDAEAVYSLAQKLASNNSLLIFKPSGGKVVHGPLSLNDLPGSNDLFIFAMQTDRQLQLLKKYAKDIVIVDIARGTNRYRYQLVSCMIVDENHQGWSVGHCIVSQLNTASLMFFFSCLKSRMGEDSDINCVITRDNRILINSMSVGFSKELRHILCMWNTYHNIKNKLKCSIEGGTFQVILDTIKMMMETRELTLFTNLTNELLCNYKQFENAQRFLLSFKALYLSCPEKWAKCYREFPHSEVDTVVHLESFYNRLKKVYLKTRTNKNLEDLINVLIAIEEEEHQTQQSEAKGVLLAPSQQDVEERHEQSKNISDDSIHHCLENIWEIPSKSSNGEHHVIVQYGSLCTRESCVFICQNAECHQLCSHMYQCSCADSHLICKHIHKLHSYLCRETPEMFLNVLESYYLEDNPYPESIVEVITEEENVTDDTINPIISSINTDEPCSISVVEMTAKEESVNDDSFKTLNPINSSINTDDPCSLSVAEMTAKEESVNDDSFKTIFSRIRLNYDAINHSLASVNTYLSSAEEKKAIDDKLLLADSVITDLALQTLNLQNSLYK